MSDQTDEASWRETILQRREAVTDYYLNEFNWRGAPVPEGFAGPRYYPPDWRWRVQARLDREAPGTGMQTQLATSIGDLRDVYAAGTFVFDVDGQEQRLTAFSNVPVHEDFDEYFIPFQDATSGKETYGAGRYLEVLKLDKGDEYVLDFNRTYNPSCAYSPRWNCPYPPQQNRLKIPVEAGEKIPFEH